MSKQSFEDYVLGEILGVGTVGTIYRARHRETGKVYALKLLLPVVGRNPLIISRFELEMMILSKLNHPHIVRCHGNGQHKDQLFFVMELVDGGTLKQLLGDHGSLSWQEAAEVGRQLASALQHAHNHGIIHRDLKPGNTFVTRDGRTKLGDFGIARDMHSSHLTDAGLTVGTYAYMCPELVNGERNATGKMDLYALGCMLFELVSGRTPFTGDNFAEIFEQHLHSEPPRLADLDVDCPPEFDELVHQLLAKDPQDRPFNARTVQGLLGEMCVDQLADVPTFDPDRPDRAADAVHFLQHALAQRISNRFEIAQVSWAKLIVLLITVALVVVLAMLWQ